MRAEVPCGPVLFHHLQVRQRRPVQNLQATVHHLLKAKKATGAGRRSRGTRPKMKTGDTPQAIPARTWEPICRGQLGSFHVSLRECKHNEHRAAKHIHKRNDLPRNKIACCVGEKPAPDHARACKYLRRNIKMRTVPALACRIHQAELRNPEETLSCHV